VIFSDDDSVIEIIKDYTKIKRNSDVGKINKGNIEEIVKLLETIPRQQKIDYPRLEISKIFNGDTSAISKNLTGWKSAVFSLLTALPNDTFNSQTVGAIAEQLCDKYPNNNNREAKVRQTLQLLRDMGLVEFTSPGQYQRLWMGSNNNE
jgi:type II restriction enzyme